MMNLAILGAGVIARSMVKTVRGMKAQGRPVSLYAVASRDLVRAEAFAQEEGVEKAYGSYEEMLADPAVDLVYVATPHSHHAEHMKLCIAAGKAILCEKAFTGNAKQAEEVLALAKEKGVLVAEAIWTRYMPVRQMILDLIAEGAIGEVRYLQASLGYAMDQKERILNPELAGGALLDLGVYTLNFASMVLGDDIVRTESSVQMFPTGTDAFENITLYYKSGVVASLQSTALANTIRNGIIYGTKGCMVIDNVNNPHTIDIIGDARDVNVVRHIDVPQQITGYEYQVESCMKALETGALECPEMPHQQTLTMMRQMDALRASWGMVYPFD